MNLRMPSCAKNPSVCTNQMRVSYKRRSTVSLIALHAQAHLAGAPIKAIWQKHELLHNSDLRGKLDDSQKLTALQAPHVQVAGSPSGHQYPTILGGCKCPVVWGGAKGRRDLVLVVQCVCLPSVDGVVFEAGDDCIAHGLEENLWCVCVCVCGKTKWYLRLSCQ